MHAVVVNVTITDPEAAERALAEQLMPRVSQLPGFVTGYWTLKDSTGLTMLIFESEEAATAMSQGRSDRSGGHDVQNVEVREVAASA